MSAPTTLSVFVVLSNAAFLVNWYTIRVRMRLHPLRAWVESMFVLLTLASGMHDLCSETNIQWCPQRPEVLRALAWYLMYLVSTQAHALHSSSPS